MSIVNIPQTRFAFALVTAIAFMTVILPGGACVNVATAGMPSLLPSSWTAEKTPSYVSPPESVSNGATALRLQAISFFGVIFLLSAGLVRWLWNTARRDFPRMPVLSYGRSIGLLTLWGLAFIVVLTMISGARELMTPGAWKKQGWTYKLADTKPNGFASSHADRQQALEQLRTALWLYAATHDGLLPDANEHSIDAKLWQIPGWPGLKFMAVRGRKAETIGQLYVFETDADGDERLVLLTNGFIGTMRSAEIKQAMSSARAEADSTGHTGIVDDQSNSPEALP
jgi:hypothetical protein